MMDSRPQLGQRIDALYVAVRDSATVDRQVAFEVAMSELEYRLPTFEERQSSLISARPRGR